MSDICRLCGQKANHLWAGALLNHNVNYYECASCGYVQTENPYWLEQAYASSINSSDTGILSRNIDNVNRVIATMWMLDCIQGRVVDFAGGYGILVRLLRDAGVDAYWLDKYSENLLARGFEDNGAPAQLVTSFEAFEHFLDPVQELRSMLKTAPAVLLSTTLIPSPTPRLKDWWYYGTDHGQHIGFFRRSSLQKLAETVGKKFVSDGFSYHLFCDKEISEWKWKKFLRKGHLIKRLPSVRLCSKTEQDARKIIGV